MAIAASDTVYCIDSSSLMQLERLMPVDIVPGLWDDLGELAETGRFVSHREVFDEIQRGCDFLVQWTKVHREMFINHTPEQAGYVAEIVRKFPNLSGAHKLSPYEADAWVIALSLCNGRKWTVVTEESAKPERRRIPTACRVFDVPSINGFELLRGENWQYVRAR